MTISPFASAEILQDAAFRMFLTSFVLEFDNCPRGIMATAGGSQLFLNLTAPEERGGFMPSSGSSKIEKVQTHFQALSSVASSLNAASDELTKVVSVLDEALKKLNIGLEVWVRFLSLPDESPAAYDYFEIGYCKINSKWGIALRHVWGDEVSDYHSQEGPWLFTDGPREMRVKGVDRIPEVIEALGSAAFETAKAIHQKTEEVRQLAVAIGQIANGEKNDATQPGGKQISLRELMNTGKEGVK